MQDDTYQSHFKITPTVRGVSKDEATTAHHKQLEALLSNLNILYIYTDGSQIKNGERTLAGAGWVLYRSGEEHQTGSKGLGSTAEVYDTEMTALLRGIQCAIEYPSRLPHPQPEHISIILFSDNDSAVKTISSVLPGSSQDTSRQFVELARELLDSNNGYDLEVA